MKLFARSRAHLWLCWWLAVMLLAGCNTYKAEKPNGMEQAPVTGAMESKVAPAPTRGGGESSKKMLDAIDKDGSGASVDEEAGEATAEKPDPNQPGSALAATGVKLPARRYIVRSAAIKLEVESVAKTLDALAKLATKMLGFASDSNLDTENSAAPEGTITLRIPAGALDEALDLVIHMGTVLTKNVKGEDITREFVDTSARLRNLRREEAQYLSIMAMAKTVKDVLPVARELARVRGEVERTQGALQHMAGLVDLATIAITLQQKSIAPPPPDYWDFSARWSNAWQNGVQHLANAVGDLVETLAKLITFLPLLLGMLALYLLFGWLISLLVVRQFQLLSRRNYTWVWLAVGFVLLGIQFPVLFGFLGAVAVALFVAWLGHVVYRRFTRPREG